MTPALRRWLDDYGADHRARGNEVCHVFGVPLVALSVLALLGPLAGAAVLAGTLAWYLWLDWRWALAFVPAALALHRLGARLGLVSTVVCFVGGWAFQFLGHYAFEKKPPAFTRDWRFLLVGPLWVYARLVGR